MKLNYFKKALCALLICSNIIAGSLIIYANTAESEGVNVIPTYIHPPLPK